MEDLESSSSFESSSASGFGSELDAELHSLMGKRTLSGKMIPIPSKVRCFL